MKNLNLKSNSVEIPASASTTPPAPTSAQGIEGKVIRRKKSSNSNPEVEIKSQSKDISITPPKRQFIGIREGEIYGEYSPEYRVYAFWKKQKDHIIDRQISRLKFELGREAYLVGTSEYEILGRWIDLLCHDAILELQSLIFPPKMKELSKEELLEMLEKRQSLVGDSSESPSSPEELGTDALLSIAEEIEALTLQIRDNLKSIALF